MVHFSHKEAKLKSPIPMKRPELSSLMLAHRTALSFHGKLRTLPYFNGISQISALATVCPQRWDKNSHSCIFD